MADKTYFQDVTGSVEDTPSCAINVSPITCDSDPTIPGIPPHNHDSIYYRKDYINELIQSLQGSNGGIFENGLTKGVDGITRLGGPLTEQFTAIGANQFLGERGIGLSFFKDVDNTGLVSLNTSYGGFASAIGENGNGYTVMSIADKNTEEYISIHLEINEISANGATVLDNIYFKGLGEIADYSANKTEYSYVTKKMLEDATSSTGSFLNGLTKGEDGITRLGGELTEAVTLIGNQTSDGNGVYLGLLDFDNYNQITLGAFRGTNLVNRNASFTSTAMDDFAQAGLTVQNNNYVDLDLNLSTEYGAKITDNLFQQGLTEAGDYSANKTDWSYITKKWALDKLVQLDPPGFQVGNIRLQDSSIHVRDAANNNGSMQFPGGAWYSMPQGYLSITPSAISNTGSNGIYSISPFGLSLGRDIDNSYVTLNPSVLSFGQSDSDSGVVLTPSEFHLNKNGIDKAIINDYNAENEVSATVLMPNRDGRLATLDDIDEYVNNAAKSGEGYTPITTAISNNTSPAISGFKYSAVQLDADDHYVVTFSGILKLNVTTASSLVSVRFSVPYESSFVDANYATGIATIFNSFIQPPKLFADTDAREIRIEFSTTVTGLNEIHFMGQYKTTSIG